MKRVRVNIRTAVNAASIRREKRNGRDVVIVPSATLPDNIVMNDIKYPAEEIERSYMTLNRTPAPLGHPIVNGKYVSASDPEGINVGWVGAWNENVRRDNGRVYLDKIIDVERASQSEGGRRVLDAINKREPIHTSTGLICDLEPAEDGAGCRYIARNMQFDHDAILLDEDGAATPEQGVGIFVNSAGEAKEIEVINSAYQQADSDLDWAVESLARALEKRQRAPFLERMKSAIVEIFGAERETSANQEKAEMADEKQLNELSAKVNALSEAIDNIGETITNAITEAIKPVKEHVDRIEANQKAQEEAERAELVEKVVKANLLDEDAAKELTLNALRKLADRAKPGKAAALNGAGTGVGKSGDEWSDYDLNAMLEDRKGKEAH